MGAAVIKMEKVLPRAHLKDCPDDETHLRRNLKITPRGDRL